MRGVQAGDEAGLTDVDRTLKVPVLGVGGALDVIGRADQMQSANEPWASKGYTEKVLQTGHWPMMEKSEELSSILVDFAARGT